MKCGRILNKIYRTFIWNVLEFWAKSYVVLCLGLRNLVPHFFGFPQMAAIGWLYSFNLQADESWIRSFPEFMMSSSMVQLTKVIAAEDAPQLTLTCLSTIPGYLGNHVHDNEYADYRADTMIGNVRHIHVTDLLKGPTPSIWSYNKCGNQWKSFS